MNVCECCKNYCRVQHDKLWAIAQRAIEPLEKEALSDEHLRKTFRMMWDHFYPEDGR